MVNKSAIKVIKRSDRIRAAAGASHSEAPNAERKLERKLHREIAGKVSGWVADRREYTRTDALLEIRRLFGGESSAGGMA